MTNVIERYVYDVVRRLPEKEREDVRRELTANIYDMLPDEPEEEDIKEVLVELGDPAVLAEQYRTAPRYLISPAVYDDYMRALKWVVPLVGVLLLTLGLVLGGIKAVNGGPVEATVSFIRGGISNGISMGVSGAFQALLWVTIGFVIADRAGYNKRQGKGGWKIEDLPEEVPNDRYKISLSDSIVELVVTVVFSVLLVLFCAGVFPAVIMARGGSVQELEVFSESFLRACVPAVAIGCALGVWECVAKIIHRHWTPFVCISVVVGNLLSMGLMLYMFSRPDMFSPEFAAYAGTQPWGELDVLRFLGNGITNPVLVLIAAVVIIASLAECGVAIYRTVRAREGSSQAA